MEFLTPDFIISILTVVLGFVFGLFVTKPGYKKFKAINKSLADALEDDNLSGAELKGLYEIIKPKVE